MPINEERHYLEVLGDELALALGQAIWAFARIEWLTYECLRRLSRDELDILVGDLGFSAKIKLVKGLVEKTKASRILKDGIIACLGSADALAKERNIIVHNPWSIWIDLDREEFMTEIQKYSNRDKKINLESVVGFTAKAQEVAASLDAALNALTNNSGNVGVAS